MVTIETSHTSDRKAKNKTIQTMNIMKANKNLSDLEVTCRQFKKRIFSKNSGIFASM